MKEFTKSDLKTGMVVELGGYGIYLVLRNTPVGGVLVKDDEWLDLDGFGENLKRKNGSEWDITQVFSPSHAHQMRFNDFNQMEMIYDRYKKPNHRKRLNPLRSKLKK